MAKKIQKKPAKKTVKKAAAKKADKKPASSSSQRTTTISPYLTFNGNCYDAFHFYRFVFGGNFGHIGRFSDMPDTGGKPVSPFDAEKIMHISLPIGKEAVLMGCDSSQQFGRATVTGNNFSISINTYSQIEADRLYNALCDGGKRTMPMNQTFWGSYFGMLTDKFGIQWMISFDAKPAVKK